MTRYLSLAGFWFPAEHVTGINAATLIRASRVELADSALHAPQAGFGDTSHARLSPRERGVAQGLWAGVLSDDVVVQTETATGPSAA